MFVIPAQARIYCAAGVSRHCEEKNDEAILPPLTPPKEGKLSPPLWGGFGRVEEQSAPKENRFSGVNLVSRGSQVQSAKPTEKKNAILEKATSWRHNINKI